MAVDYTNLFTGLGELVQRTNTYLSYYPQFTADLSEIESDFNTIGRGDIFSGIPEIFDGFRSGVQGWIGQINAKASSLLTERESILEQLQLDQTDITNVLIELYRDMEDNLETIERNTVTIGAVSEDKVNGSAGSIIVDKVLDGVSSPHADFPAIWEYNGVDSELADTENMFVEVIADSESDGRTEGNETLQVFGQVANGGRYHWDTFGSGPGPTFSPVQADTLLTNCEMEDFTSDVPDGWTVDEGTSGTHILESTATVKRGDSALQFTGTAAEDEIQISQAVTAGLFLPRKRYFCGFWIKGEAGTSAGTLTIQFEGDGYTAAPSEKIELNAATLAAMGGAFAWKYFFVNMPEEIPSDMALVIKWTGTPSAHSVYIDGGGVTTPTWHNGVSFVAYAGSDPFIKNDRFSLLVTQSGGGIFQNWFRKTYGIQMPSAAVPTIPDSLA